MIYHFEPESKLTWGKLKEIRFDKFNHLSPDKSYYGNNIKIPVPFKEIRFSDNEYHYRFSIVENTLYEKISIDNEHVELETTMTEEDKKSFLNHIHKTFHIIWNGYFVGETLENATENLYFLEKKTDEFPDYRLDIGTYSRNFKTRALVELVDVNNRFKRIKESGFYIDCYENDYMTIEFPVGDYSIDLQKHSMELFQEVFEKYKLEMLVRN
ncbi:hypothetical protein [Bacillus thuringiensis]|uniref:hypothetical protein n=1 Tax=Bacillus thuringiensis TaxID=1428 RepID=UPI0021D69B42|nr:hypothetical protein [Bacillus thuringiensis]MCU7667635.1 hypothetical protein [Bacillus thuringiensis]